MVSIRIFWIIVLVSNRIEYWSNYSIQFEILNIRTALLMLLLLLPLLLLLSLLLSLLSLLLSLLSLSLLSLSLLSLFPNATAAVADLLSLLLPCQLVSNSWLVVLSVQDWNWRVNFQCRTSSPVRVDYCKSVWRASVCSLPTPRYVW